jgi:hypothetical protein
LPLDHQQRDVKDTTEFLEKLGIQQSRAVAGALYEYTFGHPLASRIVIDNLLCDIPAARIDVRTFDERREAISETISAEVIDRCFLDQLGSRPDLRSLLWTICVLRKFSPTPLRHLAEGLSGGESKHWQGGLLLDAVRDLQETTLVQWDSATSEYTLDRMVRKIMAQNLAVREPAEFQRRHDEAVRLYDRWIEQFPHNAAGYLLERTFHRYWALSATGRPRVEYMLVSEFAERLEQVKSVPDVEWELPGVAAALRQKLDRADELRDLLSANTFGQLAHLSTEFYEEMRSP